MEVRMKLAGYPFHDYKELPTIETEHSSHGKINDLAGWVQRLITRITRKPVDFCAR